MSIVSDILKEEAKRLLALKKKYQKELSKFPKGSLSKKRRGNNNYYYLAFREKEKIKFKYIGKENSDKVKKLENNIKRRDSIKEKLKKINRNLDEIKKVFND